MSCNLAQTMDIETIDGRILPDHSKKLLTSRSPCEFELVGFPGRKAHRDVGLDRNRARSSRQALTNRCTLSWAPSYPRPRSSSNSRWVERRSRFGSLASCSRISVRTSTQIAKLGRGLDRALVLELGPVTADDLAHRRARYRQRPHDLLDRLGAAQNRRVVSGRSGPRQSSPKSFPALRAKGKDADTGRQEGSDLDAKITPQGVVIAREFTVSSCAR